MSNWLLHVDRVECPVSGHVVDYVLMDDRGNVVARLGPEHDGRADVSVLDDLGWKTGDRILLCPIDSNVTP